MLTFAVDPDGVSSKIVYFFNLKEMLHFKCIVKRNEKISPLKVTFFGEFTDICGDSPKSS